jgi:hypothetical protein
METEEMSYDPKLKEAMAEITAILAKHDIAGALTLVSETHSEYKYHFPTWSAAQFSEDGIRFKTKASEFPDKETANRALTVSLHVLLQIRDLNAQHFETMTQILEKVREHVDFNHVPYADHTPHRLN